MATKKNSTSQDLNEDKNLSRGRASDEDQDTQNVSGNVSEEDDDFDDEDLEDDDELEEDDFDDEEEDDDADTK